jgi:hypothetical protein
MNPPPQTQRRQTMKKIAAKTKCSYNGRHHADGSAAITHGHGHTEDEPCPLLGSRHTVEDLNEQYARAINMLAKVIKKWVREDQADAVTAGEAGRDHDDLDSWLTQVAEDLATAIRASPACPACNHYPKQWHSKPHTFCAKHLI